MLLLYCITEVSAPAVAPATGVGGAAVESVEHSGLRCFYSVVDSLAAEPGSLQRGALEFHAVTRRIFEQACIIPFRFPTTLASAPELDAYLGDHATQYRVALTNFRDKVQIEIRIGLAATGPTFWTARSSADGPRGKTDAPPPKHVNSGSGTFYLQSRAARARQVEQAIALCRAAIHEEVIDWRQRAASHGVRCFVLIKREAVGEFQQKIQRVQLPEASTAAVSGPWPPTEFLPVLHE